jgi:large subunit ribosomal protein L21
MKKAVIKTSGSQYVVAEGDTITVDFLKDAGKTVDFTPLLVIDDKKTTIGAPEVKGVKVTAQVVETGVKADKVTSIRYKAKKRVKTIRGHRQTQTKLKITKIA